VKRILLGCVVLLLVGATLAPGLAAGDDLPEGKSKELSTDDVARELANSNAPLASLTFKNQFRLFTGDLPHSDDQHGFTVLFQPIFPFPLKSPATVQS